MLSPSHASKGAANTALRGLPAGLVPAGFSLVAKELRVHACSLNRSPKSANPNRP
jgi:hypothetical protein